jgi:hypothetical protein
VCSIAGQAEPGGASARSRLRGGLARVLACAPLQGRLSQEERRPGLACMAGWAERWRVQAEPGRASARSCLHGGLGRALACAPLQGRLSQEERRPDLACMVDWAGQHRPVFAQPA